MLIGLTGYAGSGKSTVADILVRDHGFTRMRFAGPLKDMLRALGLTEREIDGDLKLVPCALLGGKTPRHAMVTLGTEWGRQLIDWNMWVRALMQRIDNMNSYGDGQRIVVDDARFVNEIVALKQRGAVIWRVDRPGVEALTNHPSEQEWRGEPYGWMINNSGNLNDLAKLISARLA